jgi:hypothetical protein
MVDYNKSANIAKASLSSQILNQRASGKSIGASIRGAISSKLKAKAIGVAAKFDPLNVSRKLLGKTATTILGSAFGRSASNISYFTGDKIGPVSSVSSVEGEDSSEALQILKEMLDFMKRNRKKDLKDRKVEQLFAEEKFNEEQMRQERLKASIEKFVSVVSNRAVEEEQTDDKKGILDKLKDIFVGAFASMGKLLTGMVSFLKGTLFKSLETLLGSVTKLLSFGTILKGLTGILGSLKWLTKLGWLRGITSIPALFAAAVSIPGLAAMFLAGVGYAAYKDSEAKKKLLEYDQRINDYVAGQVQAGVPVDKLEKIGALTDLEWKEYQNLSAMFVPNPDTVVPEFVQTQPGEKPMLFEKLPVDPGIVSAVQSQKVKMREEQEQQRIERYKKTRPPRLSQLISATVTKRLQERQEENNDLKLKPWESSGKVPPIINNKAQTSSVDSPISVPAAQRDDEPVLEMCFRDSAYKW